MMRECVLLVEHDDRTARQITQALRGAGFSIMVLGDAGEAIDLLRLVAFDLVLVDVGTLRYVGPAALMRVLRSAPLLRFTTPATVGPQGSAGALLLDDTGADQRRLVAAIEAQLRPAVPPLAG